MPSVWGSTPADEEYYTFISESVRRRLGISIPPHKYYMLKARLDRLFREGRFVSLPDLCAALDRDDADAWESLSRWVTTTHSFFFREAEDFPVISQFLKTRRSARLWSATCASGEEPYSLAIHLFEEGFRDFTLVASDINIAALRKAHAGIFDRQKLQAVENDRLKRWFVPHSEGNYKVKAELRNAVRFKRLNVMEEFDFEDRFDVVLCRNAMIYFRAHEIARLLNNLCRNLAPGGLLIVGKAETLLDIPPELERLSGSVYRKR